MATMGVCELAFLVSRIMRATSAPLIWGSLNSMKMMSNLMSLIEYRTASEPVDAEMVRHRSFSSSFSMTIRDTGWSSQMSTSSAR